MNKALVRTTNNYNGSQGKNRMSRDSSNSTAEIKFDFGPCPRSVDEVYSLGIKLQYFIGGLYVELTDFRQGSAKKFYKEQVMKQLAIKEEIQSLANDNLNQLLAYFYENGGPVIEPPVSEQTAREIQPFFARIADNTLKEIESIKEAARETSDEEIVKMIDMNVKEMYTAMSKLLNTVKEVSEAFENLAALNS
ncbi:MAG: GBF-interacting family 1 protein [Syntrophomonadaceae bacterium]|jgi:hypothetical protein|nr:GBF-interacting family 1 protein [Syntrophomonadaceae bacterium]